MASSRNQRLYEKSMVDMNNAYEVMVSLPWLIAHTHTFTHTHTHTHTCVKNKTRPAHTWFGLSLCCAHARSVVRRELLALSHIHTYCVLLTFSHTHTYTRTHTICRLVGPCQHRKIAFVDYCLTTLLWAYVWSSASRYTLVYPNDIW